MDPVVLGLVLVVVGAGLLALALLTLRAQQRTPPALEAPAAPLLPESSEAVLLVKTGGKIAYASQAARQLLAFPTASLWTGRPPCW